MPISLFVLLSSSPYAVCLCTILCRLSVRLTHRWTARDSIYAIAVRLSFFRRLSQGCISQKRLQFSSPIRLSDHLSVSLSVLLSSSPVCRVPMRHMLSSVRPSVCLSVRHIRKSVKTRLNLISHRFQQSTTYVQNALYAMTYIRCPSVCYTGS